MMALLFSELAASHAPQTLSHNQWRSLRMGGGVRAFFINLKFAICTRLSRIEIQISNFPFFSLKFVRRMKISQRKLIWEIKFSTEKKLILNTMSINFGGASGPPGYVTAMISNFRHTSLSLFVSGKPMFLRGVPQKIRNHHVYIYFDHNYFFFFFGNDVSWKIFDTVWTSLKIIWININNSTVREV